MKKHENNYKNVTEKPFGNFSLYHIVKSQNEVKVKLKRMLRQEIIKILFISETFYHRKLSYSGINSPDKKIMVHQERKKNLMESVALFVISVE